MSHDPFGTVKVWGLLALNLVSPHLINNGTLQTVLLVLSIAYTILRIKNELRVKK